MKPSPERPPHGMKSRTDAPESPGHDAYLETRPAPQWDKTTRPPVTITRTGERPLPDPMTATPEPIAATRSGSVRRPADALFAAGTRIGQYELIRPLGRGGMGEVHLARDLRLGRLVAVKFLTALDTRVHARFLVEAQATARCQHENIVIIHDVGEHDDRPYMVLEHIEGQTLRAWMRDNMSRDNRDAPRAPLPPGRAIELMVPVVRALVQAHEAGIVHRDLKPENIMITRTGAIKVLDFGIAKLRDTGRHDDASGEDRTPPSMSDDNAMAGTLAYMSPEQLNAETIDHRADLWAVGVMLFEMVCGQHPVPSLTVAELFYVADYDTPMPPVGERRQGLGALAGVIDRCLLKNKSDRTADARALLGDLEALLPDRRNRVLVDREDNLFTGLAAFQEDDADRFFGREADITDLVTRVRNQPLVTVIGPSGVGKSSLVRAGVIPALKRSGEGWESVVIRPGRRPIEALCDVLEQMALRTTTGDSDRTGDTGDPPRRLRMPTGGELADRTALRDRLLSEPGYLGAELRARVQRKLRRLILFVDQFEEIYTMASDEAERVAFLASLAGVADDAGSPLRVVLSMRSDFLERLAADREFMAVASRGLAVLAPMHRDGLRAALEQPLAAAGYGFETKAMVHDMLDELQGTPGALPLLQFTASQLWAGRDRDKRLITAAGYQAIGGIAGALARHADQVLAAMPGTQVKLARAIFERLVTPERTRAIVDVSELRALPGDPDDIGDVLRALADSRLVVIELGDRKNTGISGVMMPDEVDAGTAEIVHESLIAGWPRLRRWLDENQDDAAFLSRLRTAAREWQRSGKAAGMLWADEVAQQAEAWRAGYRGELPEQEEAFLQAVTAAGKRSLRRRRRVWYTVAALVAMMLVAGAVAATKTQQMDTIQAQRAALARSNERLERSLKDVDAERQAAERERQAAEAARDEAAKRQKEAEDERAGADAARQQAEDERAGADAARRQAEDERARAEQAQAEAERLRIKAEEAKQEAERERAKAESAAREAQKAKDEHKKLAEKCGYRNLNNRSKR